MALNHPSPSSAEVKEKVWLYLYTPLWAFVACARVKFTYEYRGGFATNQLPRVMNFRNRGKNNLSNEVW
jgi:hypothetical protein